MSLEDLVVLHWASIPALSILAQLGGGAGFIGMDIYSSELGMEFRIINVYAPCLNRDEFWNHLLNLSLANSDNLILAGDLNFSIGHAESWGCNAQLDPLLDTMEQLLEHHQLIYIPMNNIQPTWCNRRTEDASLAK